MVSSRFAARQIGNKAGALLVATTCILIATGSRAAAPRVAIDVGPLVECRDVTPEETQSAHTSDREIEATFHVSVKVESGRAEDLDELRLEMTSPARRLYVVDFQPRTLLASELAGDVQVCTTDDKTASLSASLGAVVSGEPGPVRIQGTPSAGVGVSQTRGQKETFQRLAPKQIVVASGTTDAGQGAFFKWRRSSQDLLEGSREATLRFRVPRDWRGDWLRAEVQVLARTRGYWGEKEETIGRARTLVALYMAGDGQAQQAARSLAAAQFGTMDEMRAADGPGRHATGTRQVAMKPVAEPARGSTNWLSLPPSWSLCPPDRKADVAAARQREVRAALDSLAALSHSSPPDDAEAVAARESSEADGACEQEQDSETPATRDRESMPARVATNATPRDSRKQQRRDEVEAMRDAVSPEDPPQSDAKSKP